MTDSNRATEQLRFGSQPLASAVGDYVRWAVASVARFARHAWQPRTRRLRLCETLSLGNRGFIAVVECEQEQFLVGGTTGSIALLAKLTPHSSASSTGPAANFDPASEE